MRLLQFISLCAALLVTGCARSTVSDPPATASERPNAVYVYDFALDLSKVSVSVPHAQLLAFKKKLRDSAMRQLLEALNRAGIASYPFGRDLPPPTGNYWLVDATFYNVDDQQTALRAFIGSGRGAHTSEAYVQISTLSTRKPERVLLFETAGQPYRPRVRDAVDEDAGRVAGIIANRIVNYYQQAGWLVTLPPNASGPAKPLTGSELMR
ncbi:MAG: DUF4410 domain-containing protein [Verrucomicrobiales bacterium]|jgi:hypothetical protein|nr:DUF4410 domain-containing protein [Verrucomicrobiales bacterium]